MQMGRQKIGVVVVLVGVVAFLLAQVLGGGRHVAASSPALRSLPLLGKVIGVDAGHGGYDGGCEGHSGRQEKEYNLEIALLVGAEIEKLGGQVIYTRQEDIALIDEKNTPGPKKRKELGNRIALMQENNVDAMVSIHMNSYSVAKYRGAQLFYLPDSPQGQEMAACLQEALETIEGIALREAKAGDYYILNTCGPALLVECGFISNHEEEQLLAQPQHQKALAKAIAKGIGAYFLGND